MLIFRTAAHQSFKNHKDSENALFVLSAAIYRPTLRQIMEDYTAFQPVKQRISEVVVKGR
jgi:hypothetical protein